MKYFLPNDRLYDQKENTLEARSAAALKEETLKIALEKNVAHENGLGRFLSLEKIEGASVDDVVEQNSKDDIFTALFAASYGRDELTFLIYFFNLRFNTCRWNRDGPTCGFDFPLRDFYQIDG